MSSSPALESLGLALRYRPRTFATLTGQRHVSVVLRAAVRSGNIKQQLLFAGGSGLGKTTVARICAAAILCETPLSERSDGDACGHCAACDDITLPGRTHPDVVEFDAASHGGKDEIREIAQRALLAPMRGRYRIYIIDEAHGLTGPGGQAFLKLLEEPPPHVLFMLATTDPEKMATANRGRCLVFELLRPTDAEMVQNLQRIARGESWELSDRVARAVLASTAPDLGVRGTLMTLEKLSGPLAQGVDPDDELLTELLGVAPSAQVSELTSLVVSGRRPEALDALAALRSRVSDSMIRSALLSWGRTSLSAALGREPGPDGVVVSEELALSRYELLVSTPPGEAWTEVLVVKLASPELSPSPESLAALVAEAQRMVGELSGVRSVSPEEVSRTTRLVERLEEATAAATDVGRRLVSATEAARSVPVPAPRQPSPAPEADPAPSRVRPAAERPSRPTPERPSRPARATPQSRSERTRPASATERPSRDRVAGPSGPPAGVPAAAVPFVDALQRRSPRTAALVKSSRIEVSDREVLISSYPALARQLSEPAVVNDLRAAAGTLALPVRVVEIPS